MLPLKEIGIGNWMQTFKTTSALLWVPLETYSENKDLNISSLFWGFPEWFRGKESTCQYRRHGFNPWVGKIPWGRKWHPTPVFLPGKSHGQRNLGDYSPWSCEESDTIEQLNNNKNLTWREFWKMLVKEWRMRWTRDGWRARGPGCLYTLPISVRWGLILEDIDSVIFCMAEKALEVKESSQSKKGRNQQLESDEMKCWPKEARTQSTYYTF